MFCKAKLNGRLLEWVGDKLTVQTLKVLKVVPEKKTL